MNRKTISMLAIGLLLGGGSIGAYQVMAAQNNNAAQAPTTTQQQKVQNPSYHGSIAIDNAKHEGKSEQDENVVFAGKAKITAEQAKQAAESKVGATASSVKLGNENGSLVYEVKVGKQEVKVDAGNGTVLKVEQADNENEKSGVENEKSGGVEKDGIDHQFEGQEQHAD